MEKAKHPDQRKPGQLQPGKARAEREKPHPAQEQKVPGGSDERSDKDAIGRPVQLDAEPETARPSSGGSQGRTRHHEPPDA